MSAHIKVRVSNMPWIFYLYVFSHSAASPRHLHLCLTGYTLIDTPLLRHQRTSVNRCKDKVVLARVAIVLFQILLFLFGKLKGLGVCYHFRVTRVSKVVEETPQVQLHVVNLFRCVNRCFCVYFSRVCFQPVQCLLLVALITHNLIWRSMRVPSSESTPKINLKSLMIVCS